MKKRFVSILLMALVALSLVLTACNKPVPSREDIEATIKADVDANVVEQVAKDYLVAEMGKGFEKADACIPWAYVVATEVSSDDTVTLYGDFWIDNYDVKGDTLECVSGGNFAGVMKMEKNGSTYKVVKFDQVEDGSNYTSSAKELFGTYYKNWARFQTDDAKKKEIRTQAVADYVKAHSLQVTQYQDYGWDPVSLETN